MLIYEINFSLFTLFSLLIYMFGGRGLKGRAGCRQTEVLLQHIWRFRSGHTLTLTLSYTDINTLTSSYTDFLLDLSFARKLFDIEFNFIKN